MMDPGFAIDVVMVLSFVVPMVQFAFPLPSRDGIWWRRLVSAAAIIVFAAIAQRTSLFFGNTLEISYLEEAIKFGLIVAFSSALIYLCKDTTIWEALYCSTSGFIAQNFGSTIAWIFLLLYGEIASGQPPAVMVPCFIAGILAAFLLCWVLFGKKVRAGVRVKTENMLALALLAITILVNILASSAIKSLDMASVPLNTRLAFSVAHAVTCIITLYLEFEILVNRRLIANIATTESLLAERERQYESSRDTVDAVNARMHDIRHALAKILTRNGKDSALTRDDLRDAIRLVHIYDTTFRTGNTAIDTILSEKSLVCEHEGITLSCIIDGGSLEWMGTSDAYALIGSILDDAIACEKTLDNRADRSITLVIKRMGGMASIHEEHRRGAGPEGRQVPSDAVAALIESFDGTLTSGFEDESSFLNAVIPIP